MNIDKPFVIYGVGNLGKIAKKYFDDLNIEYVYAVDDYYNTNYGNDEYWKYTVIHKLNDLSVEEKENYLFIACITTHSFNDIKNNLLKQGCKNVIAFYHLTGLLKKDHPLDNGWFCDNPDEFLFHKVYDSLDSIVSKLAYYSFYEWRVKQEEMAYFANCNDRFFIPEILDVLNDKETFVDAGAYDGRVTLEFLDKVNNYFEKIYVFEPDNINIEKLRKNIYLLNNKDIFVVNKALGDNNKNIGFLHGNDFFSKIDEKSCDLISMNTLDNYGIKPTIIKYHLEGYELKAIQGSINTIKKHRPVVMVTTYHSKDGLYDLPVYLFDNLIDYKFLWRNHNYQGQGSVMYCIPKERNKNNV